MPKPIQHFCIIPIQILQKRQFIQRTHTPNPRFHLSSHHYILLAHHLVVNERRRCPPFSIPITATRCHLHESLSIRVLTGEFLDKRSKLRGAGFHLHRTRNVHDFETRPRRFLASLCLFFACYNHREFSPFFHPSNGEVIRSFII
uniref:Uncharacterized protein n=1 Tax=Cucumis sativus TaxID=3659 RepID=A0A0A0KRR6_CUCSA